MTFLFDPPFVGLSARTVHGNHPGNRLSRHFVGIPQAKNVFLLDDDSIVDNPDDWERVVVAWWGARGPYEVTGEQKALLEAAGYTVVTV